MIDVITLGSADNDYVVNGMNSTCVIHVLDGTCNIKDSNNNIVTALSSTRPTFSFQNNIYKVSYTGTVALRFFVVKIELI